MHRGQLLLAPFLYSDLQGAKARPACVVSSDAFNSGPDVIVAMVTSRRARLEQPQLGDVVVHGWQEAGLRLPSAIRAGRLLVLERRPLNLTLAPSPPGGRDPRADQLHPQGCRGRERPARRAALTARSRGRRTLGQEARQGLLAALPPGAEKTPHSWPAP